MSETLQKRVRAAAVAGWWTIFIVFAWMTVAWCGLLVILNAKPGWILMLWGGGDLDWPDVQEIVLLFFSLFKLMLFAIVIVVIWLTLWSRQLKREG